MLVMTKFWEKEVGVLFKKLLAPKMKDTKKGK